MMNKETTKPQALKAPRASETLFPGKLHSMMDFVEQKGLEYIISWVQNGTAIMIHDPKLLVEHVLPYFFGQSKVRSFHRQFYMWRFERVAEGVCKGAFTHPFFLKHHKSLCTLMSRHIDPMSQLSRLQGLIAANNQAAAANNNNNMIQQQQPMKESIPASAIEPLPLNELVPFDAAHRPTSTSTLSGLIRNNPMVGFQLNLREENDTTSVRKQPPTSTSDVATPTSSSSLPQNLLDEKLNCLDVTTMTGTATAPIFSSPLIPSTQDNDDDGLFSIGTIENCDDLEAFDDTLLDPSPILPQNTMMSNNNNDDSSFEQECNLISWG